MLNYKRYASMLLFPTIISTTIAHAEGNSAVYNNTLLGNSNTKSWTAYTASNILGIEVPRVRAVYWKLVLGYEMTGWETSRPGTVPQRNPSESLIQNEPIANSIPFNITYLA